jgi:hypothetical protein
MSTRERFNSAFRDQVENASAETASSLEFTKQLHGELQVIENGKNDVATFVARAFERMGAVVALQESKSSWRDRDKTRPALALAVGFGSAALLRRRHRILSDFAFASLGLASLLTLVPRQNSRNHSYTLTAELGNADAESTLILCTTNSTATVCLLELARQMQAIPPTHVRVLLMIGANPSIDPKTKDTFVLALDGLGGRCLSLPRGLDPTHSFSAAALDIVDELARSLHLDVESATYPPPTALLPPLPQGHAGIRLGSLPGDNGSGAEVSVNYETLAAATRLCTALVHQLDTLPNLPR